MLDALEIGLVFVGFLALLIVIGVPYLLVSHARLKARVADLEAWKAQHSADGAQTRRRAQDTAQAPAPAPSSAKTEKSTFLWGTSKTEPFPAPDRTLVADETTHSPSATLQGTAETEQSETAVADQSSQSSLATATPSVPPRAFVFRQDVVANLGRWLRDNWVLAIGAASLALAGVFLVQYGAENGLLTPFWRVMTALGFGGALISGGEIIRRRHGDDGPGSMRYLPSALAGAGLIALFSAILSARAMYDLIAAGPALLALSAIACLALILGWFYGPFLSALGIIGATAAPFLVGGNSDTPWVFYYYFALIALVGLAIDTVKRWAWVSVLALGLPTAAIWLLFQNSSGEQHFLSALLLITAAALVIPERRMWPRHAGIAFVDMAAHVFLPETPPGDDKSRTIFPEFPTRLSAAMVVTTTTGSLMVTLEASTPDSVYLGIGGLVILLLATVLWMYRAPALYDHALIPGAGLLAVIFSQSENTGPLFSSFVAALERPTETSPPAIVWVLITIATLVSLLAFLRMQQEANTVRSTDQEHSTALFWALVAASYAPIAMLMLELFWQPAAVLGAYPWALTALAMAAVMTLLAERSARTVDTSTRALRVALFAIAALTLISLAFFLILAKTALTLALTIMVLLTVLIDRKFDLPALGAFVQLGVAIITFRLIIDPGFGWATDVLYQHDQAPSLIAPWGQVLLAYLGTLGLLTGAYWCAGKTRPKTTLILESAIATILAVFVSVLISRLLTVGSDSGHAQAGLMATVWAASLFNQLYRLQASGRFSKALRGSLATIYAVTLLFWTVQLFTTSNPLIHAYEQVSGPLVLDSLFAAYTLLAAACALAAWKIRHFGRRFQLGNAAAAAMLISWYIALEIRRFWRGDDLSVYGVSDPELYSYTVALLMVSIGLLVLAFWKRSDILRRLAMAGVVITIAKVFLIDMSGLSGLTRVFSFMGLGLALVALAWLNRVMTAQWDQSKPAAAMDEPDPDPNIT